MAFISDEHRLVFLHLTKNGGTSVKDALCRLHGTQLQRDGTDFAHDGVGVSFDPRFRPNDIDVHDPWRYIVRKCPRVADYRVFCVMRNPWARIFSYYQHKLRRCDADMPQARFADVMARSNALLLHPQQWWLPEGHQVHVLGFDRLAEDWASLAEALDVDLPPLRHLNRTIEPTRYQQEYDDYARETVAAYYRWEIERYGFRF